MSTADRPPPPPIRPPNRDERGRRLGASMVGTPWRTLAMCLGSLAFMAPWPLLGILLVHPYFDRASEAFMLFGGITLFPLMILALFGSVSEEVLIALLLLVWLAAAVIPNLWLRRHLTSWSTIGGLLGAQTAFALAQAAMGVLLILGKNV